MHILLNFVYVWQLAINVCGRACRGPVYSYKTFFMLNSSEHENFSAHKYENANIVGIFIFMTLRKHAYSNLLKTLQTKKGNLPIKNSDIFHISAQNIDCGYSLEPPR